MAGGQPAANITNRNRLVTDGCRPSELERDGDVSSFSLSALARRSPPAALSLGPGNLDPDTL